METTADNCVSLPLHREYAPTSGKTEENMEKMFLEHCTNSQICQRCASANEGQLVTQAMLDGCNSFCEECWISQSVCIDCRDLGHTSHSPSLRACDKCIRLPNTKCHKLLSVAIVSDYAK